MEVYIDRILITAFFGFIFIIQPLWSWGAAHWLVRYWVSRNQPGRGWLAGFGSLIGIYSLGLLGIYIRLTLIQKSCGSYTLCCEYCGLSYLFDYASGVICLIIFLISAIRVTRQQGRVAPD